MVNSDTSCPSVGVAFTRRLAIVLMGLAGVTLALSSAAVAQQGGAVVDLAGCEAETLPANDDGSTDLVPIGFPVDFFGEVYDSLYVNNNGNVTFDSALSAFTPFNLNTTDRVIIAPFFADVDTHGENSAEVTYGEVTYDGRDAFCVNYRDVGYYSSHDDKLNDFQLLLVDRSTAAESAFDIIFNYDQIQWETGDFSGGTDGLGGDSARVGFSSGGENPESLELSGSAVNGAFLDDNASQGLIHNSRTSVLNPVLGRYVFRVGGGEPPAGGGLFGTVTDGDDQALAGATVEACTAAVCRATGTNAGGGYTISGLEPGEYELRAFPPSGRSDLVTTASGPVTVADVQVEHDIVMDGLQPLPEGTTLEPSNPGDSGIPVVFWSDDLDLTVPGCAGGTGQYTVTVDGVVVAEGALTETSPGVYSGTVPPLSPNTGTALVTTTVDDCPDPADDSGSEFNIYIDPSGFVRTTDGDPIPGATVTLFRSVDEDPETGDEGPYEQVPDGSAIMDPSNRTNPDLTDAEGHFGWDVITGWYLVRAEAAGCVDPEDPEQTFIETDPMFIPPEVTDLDLRLLCEDDVFEEACPVDDVPGAAFVDIDGNTHEDAIECAAWHGLTQGTSETTYSPALTVRRDQMAAFIARLLTAAGVELPAPSDQGFTDIARNTHADAINQLAEIGVVFGTTETTYAPAARVRRDQMGSFLVRAYEHADGSLPDGDSPFTDIEGNTHEDAIDKAFAAGFTLGATETTYAPAARVRRDQMGSFLVRAYEHVDGPLPDGDSPFTDIEGNTHEDAIDKAFAAGFTLGATETTYAPAAQVRRDQMASFLTRVLDRLAGEGYVDAPA